jgi:hypothetical protein
VWQTKVSEKYVLTIEPADGKVKKGDKLEVTFKLMFKCTARVNEEVVLAILGNFLNLFIELYK